MTLTSLETPWADKFVVRKFVPVRLGRVGQSIEDLLKSSVQGLGVPASCANNTCCSDLKILLTPEMFVDTRQGMTLGKKLEGGYSAENGQDPPQPPYSRLFCQRLSELVSEWYRSVCPGLLPNSGLRKMERSCG